MKEKDNILEELKTISTVLDKIKKQEPPTVVPENYFSAFTKNMLLKIKEESTILSSIPKQNLAPPPYYFENLTTSVLEKIKQNYKTPRFSIVRIFRQTAIAAAFIGVLFLVKKTSTNVPATTVEQKIASLTQEEVYSYMNDNSYDFSMDQIKKAVAPIINNDNNTEVTVTINDSSIETYLNENKNLLDAEDDYTDIF